MGGRRGRWLDLGMLPPVDLHAAYTGIAESLSDTAEPVLMWARSPAHVCLGASQWAGAELDLDACQQAAVPVLRRPLGGGTVWVDAQQACFFLIVPRQTVGGRHETLFARCLEAVVAVYHRFDLPVEQVGETDIWLHGRKILGSGAATLRRAMVFGSSFLFDFDAVAFSRVVACPSAGFRTWLAEALAEGMTTWAAQVSPPAEPTLQTVLCEVFGAAFDCRFEASMPDETERAAMAVAREDCMPEDMEEMTVHRLVRHGIKINHHDYLVETGTGVDMLRLWLRRGRVYRITAGEPALAEALQVWLDCEPERQRLLAVLAEAQSLATRQSGAQVTTQTATVSLRTRGKNNWAEHWAGRIDEAARDVRRLWHG